jgi:hypothetical protein
MEKLWWPTRRRRNEKARARKRGRSDDDLGGGKKNYLLLCLVVLAPIGWIKVDRNRRKDHGKELISFDLLLLLVCESFFSGLFDPPRNRRTCQLSFL